MEGPKDRILNDFFPLLLWCCGLLVHLFVCLFEKKKQKTYFVAQAGLQLKIFLSQHLEG